MSQRESGTRLAPGYAIRLARPSDLAPLPGIERAAARLFREFGVTGIDVDAVTDIEDLEEAREEGQLWVAVAADDRPVGFALASRVGENAHLDELDVHPDHGRRGLGKALVDAVLSWARGAGLPAVTLTTLRHVPFNAPFYERLGFRVLTARERGPILDELLRDEIERGHPAENRVAMRCEL